MDPKYLEEVPCHVCGGAKLRKEVLAFKIGRFSYDDIEKLELSKDEEKGIEKDIQDIVNEYNKKVEAKLKEKEQELLTV